TTRAGSTSTRRWAWWPRTSAASSSAACATPAEPGATKRPAPGSGAVAPLVLQARAAGAGVVATDLVLVDDGALDRALRRLRRCRRRAGAGAGRTAAVARRDAVGGAGPARAGGAGRRRRGVGQLLRV